MTAEEGTRNLYQRIAGLMHALDPVEKSGRVNFGTTRYSYVRADTLFAMLQKKLAEAGVVVVPSIESVQASPDGSKVLLAAMKMRLVNSDNPADYLEVPWFAQGTAGDDKSVNKCGTSGLKSFLMKLLLVSDEEDPDTEAGPDPKGAARAQTPPARLQQQHAPPARAQTNDEAEASALEIQHRRLYNAAQRDQEGKILLLSYLQQQSKARITDLTMAEATEWLLILHDRAVTPDAPAPAPAEAGA